MRSIEGQDLLARVKERFRCSLVVLLLGPRKCGKTTLTRQFAEERRVEYFDVHKLAKEMTGRAGPARNGPV